MLNQNFCYRIASILYFLCILRVIFADCRDELYKQCVAALRDGLLLSGKDFDAIRKALREAFENVDMKLLNW